MRDDATLSDAVQRLLATITDGAVTSATCERLSAGASQETYRIDADTPGGRRRYALRRNAGGAWGRSGVQQIGLSLEARLLERARANGVPVPAVLHVLRPEDDLGEGFLMEWLDGETLGARIARGPELAGIRPRLARQCGEVLARIHAIDVHADGLDQVLETLTPEAYVRRLWERYQAYATPQPMIDYTARWLLEHLPPAGPLSLVHNDFRNGNLMVAPEAGIVAVLDWELAHIGDPMRDLGWLCTNSWRFGAHHLPVGGFGERAELFAGYEAVSGRRIDPDAVRYWEVFGSYWWAIGCLTMAGQYRDQATRSVERPGIGRRSSECQVDCVNLLLPGPVTQPIEPPPENPDELLRTEELIESVRDFLREEVMTATAGRTRFLARVAANSLDIVRREFAAGPPARAAEHDRLEALLGSRAALSALRWRLVERLRDGSLALDAPGLATHLRQTVVDQVAIDQPGYAALASALSQGAD
jgi:aminoglycoside phosphotransferase (APT) family kinase protein